jgi:hypothetical protein
MNVLVPDASHMRTIFRLLVIAIVNYLTAGYCFSITYPLKYR